MANAVVYWAVSGKLLQPFEDIVFHAAIHPVLVIISFQVDSKVQFAVPVFTDGIVLFDGVGEVIGVLPANVLNTKIIHRQ